MTEKELQQAVVDLARLLGWKVMHARAVQVDGRWHTPIQGDPGFPDLVLARDGVIIFAELKSERGRMSETQAEWFNELSGGPNLVTIWKPKDWLDGTIEARLKGSRVAGTVG